METAGVQVEQVLEALQVAGGKPISALEVSHVVGAGHRDHAAVSAVLRKLVADGTAAWRLGPCAVSGRRARLYTLVEQHADVVFEGVGVCGEDPWAVFREMTRYEGLDRRGMKAAYRRAALTYHPDHGGDSRAFARLCAAWDDIQRSFPVR